MWWLVLASPAEGAPRCDALDAAAFREVLARGQALIDAEELASFEALRRSVVERAPCFTYVPDPRDWARFLVAVAVVAHFRGEDWRTPLATALWIAPDVDRGVGPGHEIARWEPPAPAPGRPAPGGGEWFVDGIAADALPSPTELHLVQLRTDDGMRSAVLQAEPVPAGWVATPTPEPLVVTVAVSGGARSVAQRVQPDGDYVSAGDGVAGTAGVVAQGWFGRLPAVAARGEGSLDPRGELAAGARGRGWFVGAGLAADHASYSSLDGSVGRVALTPALSVHAWAPPTVDLGAAGGGFPGHAFARGELGAGLGKRVRASVDLRWEESRWVQAEVRELVVTEMSAAATLGLAWGRAR